MISPSSMDDQLFHTPDTPQHNPSLKPIIANQRDLIAQGIPIIHTQINHPKEDRVMTLVEEG